MFPDEIPTNEQEVSVTLNIPAEYIPSNLGLRVKLNINVIPAGDTISTTSGCCDCNCGAAKDPEYSFTEYAEYSSGESQSDNDHTGSSIEFPNEAGSGSIGTYIGKLLYIYA